MILVLASSALADEKLLSTLVAQFDIRARKLTRSPSRGSRRSIMCDGSRRESVKAYVERGINLGADTTVVLEGQIIGKPSDVDEARWILGRLSGKTHTVYTAVALAQSAGVDTLLSATKVTLTQLSQRAIDAYLLSG